MVHISEVSKLDGIKSWSLMAGETCPGSYAPDGVLVDACAGCYAMQGNYRFPNVQLPRRENKDDWQRAAWVSDMVEKIGPAKFFRWFDSGDMYALPLARKILAVMERTPNCRHWLPTRMHKFPKFAAVIEQMQALPNVMVRPSSDSVTGEFSPVHGSTIIPTAESAAPDVAVCRAYQHGGKCNGCRQCWDKSIPVIGYVAHGRSMAKVIRIKQAA